MKLVNRFLMWLAERHPFAATILSGGMPSAGRAKYLDYIDGVAPESDHDKLGLALSEAARYHADNERLRAAMLAALRLGDDNRAWGTEAYKLIHDALFADGWVAPPMDVGDGDG